MKLFPTVLKLFFKFKICVVGEWSINTREYNEKIWRSSIFEVDHAISFKNMITR